jgi:hypothetical protein
VIKEDSNRNFYVHFDGDVKSCHHAKIEILFHPNFSKGNLGQKQCHNRMSQWKRRHAVGLPYKSGWIWELLIVLGLLPFVLIVGRWVWPWEGDIVYVAYHDLGTIGESLDCHVVGFGECLTIIHHHLSSWWQDYFFLPFFNSRIEQNRSTIWDVLDDVIPTVFGSTSKNASKIGEKLFSGVQI